MKVRVMLVREGPRETPVEVSGPAMAFLFLRPKARNLDREHFWRLDLDARNRIIGYEVVSIGTLTASLVHTHLCSAKHKWVYVTASIMLRSGRAPFVKLLPNAT